MPSAEEVAVTDEGRDATDADVPCTGDAADTGFGAAAALTFGAGVTSGFATATPAPPFCFRMIYRLISFLLKRP